MSAECSDDPEKVLIVLAEFEGGGGGAGSRGKNSIRSRVGSSSIVLAEKRCEWKASLWAMADQHEQPGHWKKEQVYENEAG